MKFVVDDCMDAFLGDTQLNGNATLRYSSVCHDDVMNLGNGPEGSRFTDCTYRLIIQQPTSSPC